MLGWFGGWICGEVMLGELSGAAFQLWCLDGVGKLSPCIWMLESHGRSGMRVTQMRDC